MKIDKSESKMREDRVGALSRSTRKTERTQTPPRCHLHLVSVSQRHLCPKPTETPGNSGACLRRLKLSNLGFTKAFRTHVVAQSTVYAVANWYATFVFFRTAVHELSDRASACVRKWSIFRVGLKRKNVCLSSHSRVEFSECLLREVDTLRIEGMCQCFHQCKNGDGFSYITIDKRSN